MVNFEYINAQRLEEVPALLSEEPGEAKLLAGGTDLLGELKERTMAPRRLVNLKSIPGLRYIQQGRDGLRLGALTTLAEIAAHPVIREKFTALAQAAEAVAVPQIRNIGTLGGNLCQRPRCWYYRSVHFHCLKKGGEQCFAYHGDNRYHAILGGGPCYIVHPSDTAPALVALNAKATIHGPEGTRRVPLEEFFTLPEVDVTRENILKPNETVTEVQVPTPRPTTRSRYIKLREKQSLDFALVSVAVVMVLDGDRCRQARLVLGGVAPIPRRAKEAEAALQGQRVTENLASRVAEAAVAGAEPLRDNAYKVTLAKALVKRAVLEAGKA